jgi:hypothetical protein
MPSLQQPFADRNNAPELISSGCSAPQFRTLSMLAADFNSVCSQAVTAFGSSVTSKFRCLLRFFPFFCSFLLIPSVSFLFFSFSSGCPRRDARTGARHKNRSEVE